MVEELAERALRIEKRGGRRLDFLTNQSQGFWRDDEQTAWKDGGKRPDFMCVFGGC